MQRVPQLARGHALRALAMLPFEGMHDLADPVDAALGILRLSVGNIALCPSHGEKPRFAVCSSTPRPVQTERGSPAGSFPRRPRRGGRVSRVGR